MPDTAPSAVSAEFAEPAAPDLAGLRAELDRLDDALHDLLMERADVVARVAADRAKGRVKLRPGREAAIVRRLLGRHRGALPPQALVRIWRELFAASTAMQAPLAIAVCEADPGGAFVQCAREHFGALTPLHAHRSPAQAIAEVSAGTASAAVLPMPSESEPRGVAWWTALLHRDDPRIHVVARLPFWAPRPDGAPRVEALVVAAIAPDPTSDDRALIGLELPADVSRARLSALLLAAGFAPGPIVLRREVGAPVAHALVDVAGNVADTDPRLDALGTGASRPIVLGAYAVPADGAAA